MSATRIVVAVTAASLRSWSCSPGSAWAPVPPRDCGMLNEGHALQHQGRPDALPHRAQVRAELSPARHGREGTAAGTTAARPASSSGARRASGSSSQSGARPRRCTASALRCPPPCCPQPAHGSSSAPTCRSRSGCSAGPRQSSCSSPSSPWRSSGPSPARARPLAAAPRLARPGARLARAGGRLRRGRRRAARGRGRGRPRRHAEPAEQLRADLRLHHLLGRVGVRERSARQHLRAPSARGGRSDGPPAGC